jgi:uncharacterized YccA/Bax inhibitor family protein
MAANALGTALHIDKVDPSEEGISATLANALGDPASRQAALQAEQAFQAQMAELGYKSETDMESLAVQDRESARAREISVKDYTPEIGFYLLMVIFAFVIHWLLKWPVPDSNKAIVYSAIGSLGTLVVMAATYFYGTTRGSENKSATISATTNTLVNKVAQK